jgi:predicted PurR-regulated permease PerM
MSFDATAAAKRIAGVASAAVRNRLAGHASAADPPSSRVTVDIKGASLGILASLATLAALSWAQGFVIPLLLGVVIAYTLYPLVAWLALARIPRVVGAMIVMLGILGALAYGAYSLRGQMQAIIESLPEAAAKVSGQIARIRINQVGNLQTVQSAATAVEKAATQAAGGSAAAHRTATHVIVDQPTFRLDNFLLKGSLGSFGALGQAATVIVLAFFLLIGGDTLRRIVVRLTGPPLSKEKVALHVLNDINGTIQKYLFMLLATNVLVALLTWLAFHLLGLENAGAWGTAAGVLHVVPYLGPVLIAGAVGIAAFVQFDSVAMALLIAGASLLIAAVVGTLVTTWMTGRIAKLNPAVVFIALMFWGWMWGIPGMLLSVPIVVIAKVLSKHVKQLAPLGELLGSS